MTRDMESVLATRRDMEEYMYVSDKKYGGEYVSN